VAEKARYESLQRRSEQGALLSLNLAVSSMLFKILELRMVSSVSAPRAISVAPQTRSPKFAHL
jgi:hypothetical protein